MALMGERDPLDAAFLTAMAGPVSTATIDRLIEGVRARFGLPGEMPYDAAGARAQELLAEVERDPEAFKLFMEWRAQNREEDRVG